MTQVAHPRSRLIAVLAKHPHLGGRRILHLAITTGVCSGVMVGLLLHAIQNRQQGATPWLLPAITLLLAIITASMPPLLTRTRTLAGARIANLRETALPRLLSGSPWPQEMLMAFERLPSAMVRAGFAAVAALCAFIALVIACGYLVVTDRTLGLVATFFSTCICCSGSWQLWRLLGFPAGSFSAHSSERTSAEAGTVLSAVTALRGTVTLSAYDQLAGSNRIAELMSSFAVADAALLEQDTIGLRARVIAFSLTGSLIFAAAFMAGPERLLSPTLAALLLPFVLATILSNTFPALFIGEQAARSWDTLEAMLDASLPTATEATFSSSLVFQKVFGDPARPTLGPIDLSLKPGVIAVITGGAGSGKSHVIGLLSGRIVAGSGRIVLDGQNKALGEAAMLLRSQTMLLATGHYPPVLPLSDNLARETAAALVAFELNPARFLDDNTLLCGQTSSSEAFRAALAHAMLSPYNILLIDDAVVGQDCRLTKALSKDWLPRLAERGKSIVIASNHPAIRECATLEVNLGQGWQNNSDTAKA